MRIKKGYMVSTAYLLSDKKKYYFYINIQKKSLLNFYSINFNITKQIFLYNILGII